MRQRHPDLSQTAEQRQFSILTAHAHLLERPGGNAVLYNPRSTGDFQANADLGGITHHYLSHCHEVDHGLIEVAGRSDSKLCCHARVEAYLTNTMSAASYFDSPDQELHAGDVGVIHTPESLTCIYTIVY